MNAPSTPRELLELVRQSGVVPEERLVSYLRSRQKRWKRLEEPGAAAEQLLADGMVSQFQAQQMLRGKCKGFWIKKYLVLESLGAGGMGQVLLCEQTPMSRLVAVKLLNTDTQPGALERFVREARAVAALDHPNIVRAIDIDQDDRYHFLVMEYVDGIDLQNLVDKHGRLDTGRACHYVAQAALGLQHAHEAGWVHRDIKAGNLLVDRNGLVKILDMGLARLTTDNQDKLTQRFDDGAIIGTADYLAPEQTLPGEKVDARADIYSLGFTLYFLLTGKTPFGAGSVLQKIVAHQVKKPLSIKMVRPDLPKELTVLIEKMMSKSPAQRPQTAREVAAVLRPLATEKAYPLDAKEVPDHCPRVRQLLQAAPTQAPSLSGLDGATPQALPARRVPVRLLFAAAIIAFLCFCVGVGGVLWWLTPRNLNADNIKDAGKDKGANNLEVPGILTPEEALKNTNRICTVQMTVRSTSLSKKQEKLLLHSHEKAKADNFTIVIQRVKTADDLGELQKKYLDKTIRVTGRVTEQRQIVVASLANVEIVVEPETVTPEEAARNVNKVCMLQMLVKSTGLSKGGDKLFLNSQAKFTAANNFTVVVEQVEAEKELQKKYQGATIRVKGKVTQFGAQPQIVVAGLASVEIVAEPEKKK
jgi:serine/threonine protein kinase